MEPSRSICAGVELTTQCQLWFLDDIRHLLSDSNLCLLRKSFFGHLFDIVEMKFQGELMNLLCKRLHSSSLDRKTLAFNFSGYTLEFGAADFCLMTGLKFGDKPSLPLHSKFHGLVFPGESNLSFYDIQNAFRKECLVSGGKSVRSLKLAYLIIVHGLLLLDHSGGRIDLGYMHLLDNEKHFDEYPWGLVAYEHLVTCTHRLKKELSSLDGGRRTHATEAFGFIYALQCWAYEVLPALGTYCACLNPDKLLSFPRILRWSVSKDLQPFEDVLCKFFLAEHGSDPVGFVLSSVEKKKLEDLGFNASFIVASPIPVIDLTKRVGRKLDFDNVEKNVPNLKRAQSKRKSDAVSESPEPLKSKKDDDVVHSSVVGSRRSVKSGPKRRYSKNSQNVSSSKKKVVTPPSGNLSCQSNSNDVMSMLVRLNVEVKTLEELMVSKFSMLQRLFENSSCANCVRCSCVGVNVNVGKEQSDLIGDSWRTDKDNLNVSCSRKFGGNTSGFGSFWQQKCLAGSAVYDPNVIDEGSPELEAYISWRDMCASSIGKTFVLLPTEILKYADVDWFNDLWKHDGWLENTHVDALTNLLVIDYDKEPRASKPRKWTCLEVCCWQVLRDADVDNFSPVVLPYVRGEKPLSGGVSWGDATHVYGVANINNCHWVLYVVSLHEQLITIYNSVNQSWDCILEHFGIFRKNIATMCAIGGFWERSYVRRPPLKSSWDIVEFPNPPRQTNQYDCGIMVIKYMECLAYNVPIYDINPKVCENSRQRYCGKLYKLSREMKHEQT